MKLLYWLRDISKGREAISVGRVVVVGSSAIDITEVVAVVGISRTLADFNQIVFIYFPLYACGLSYLSALHGVGFLY